MNETQKTFVQETIAKYGIELALEVITDIGLEQSQGKGVPKDTTSAAKWWKIAADLGYGRAQFLLGSVYCSGDGVAKDADQGMDWYLRAAEQGNADALYNLGWMYHGGERSQAETVQALAWFYLAHAKGHRLARKTVSIIEDGLPFEQVAEATKLAGQLSQKLSKGS